MLYAPTYASISSLSVTDFVWATATDTTVTFSEPVTTCVPTINGAGASVVVKSFTTGTNTAVFTVTAASGSNILSTTLLDVNEGVSAVDTKAITSTAPVLPWDGWTQVGLKTGTKWAYTTVQQDDQMQGASAWGTPGDTAASWGVVWAAAKPGYTEVMLATKNMVDLSTWKGAGATGYKWITINRIPAAIVASSGSYLGTIKTSWNSTTPFTTEWFLRPDATDPFIFATKDGHTSTTTNGQLEDCYYAEVIGVANGALYTACGGINIYVR
jgi:hypothetical protein